MRLRHATTITSVTRAYWIAGAAFATVVTARWLGPEGRGVIAAATSWLFLFSTFAHLSLGHVVMYMLSGAGRARLPVVAGSVIAIMAAATFLCWAIVAGVYLTAGSTVFQHIPLPALAVACASLPLLLWIEYSSALLTAIGDLKRLNLAQIAGTTTGIVVVVVAVAVLKGGVVAALGASFAGYVVCTAVGLRPLIAAIGRPLVSGVVVRELLRGGVRLHIGAMGTFFLVHASILLLNHFRPVEEVGYTQLAMQVMLALQIVPMAVLTVAYSLVAREGPDAAWPAHRRLVAYTMTFQAVAAAGLWIAAPLTVRLLAGRGFEPAVPLVRILMLAVLGAGLAAVMTPQWVTRGYFLRASMLSVTAMAVAIGGNWIFVPRYGMYGAAWVIVASYNVHLIGNGVFVWWLNRHG